MQIYIHKYLETNAVRKLAVHMTDENFIEDKYTSILSLIELISGISNDKNFTLRQSIIRKIAKSKIKVDTEFPETKIYNAFGFKVDNNKIVENIYHIIRIIDDAVNYDGLLKTIRLNHLDEYWTLIKRYDDNSTLNFTKSIENYFMKNNNSGDFRTQHTKRWTINIHNLKTTIVRFFASILLESYCFEEKRNLEEVISSYDNSIDIYLVCMSFYVDEKVSNKNLPGSNDYIDLNHLTYLYKGIPQIVSDDKLLHRILNNLFPRNILKTSDIV